MQEKIKKYLEWKGTYAPRACVNYKIWLVRFIQVCGIKPLAQYELADYIRYSKWIESHYSSYCIQYSTVVIKNFFKFYRDQDEKCMSPSLIKIPRFRANSHRAITEEEYNKIIAEIPNNNFLSLRNLLIIRLLWDTGVRVSELCELNVPQVNEINHSCVIYF
jgi:site-specific recombinase XerD